MLWLAGSTRIGPHVLLNFQGTMDNDFMSSLAGRGIAIRVWSTYWPVILTTICYLPVLLTSLLLRKPRTARRTWLDSGSSLLVTMWALIAVFHLMNIFETHVNDYHPLSLVRLILLAGVDATFALGLVLFVVAVRASLSRHLAIPIGITLGSVAAIAAVYGDFIFSILLATPVGWPEP